MTLTMYAIPNCDTVKKARKWLEENSVEYNFHDYKKLGVPSAVLKEACSQFGWEQVLNMRGMTWRKLADAQKSAVTDITSAVALMQEKPSIIKRPIIEGQGIALLGFNAQEYEKALV